MIGIERDKQELLTFMKLVTIIVNKLLRKHRHLRRLREDLISEGYIGMIKAYDLYDPTKGASKVSYVSRGIKNALNHFLYREYTATTQLLYIDYIENLPEVIEEEKAEDLGLVQKYEPELEIDKRIYECCIIEKNPTKTVAKEFGVTDNTIRLRKSRLVRELRRQMLEEDVLNENKRHS